VSNIFEHPAAPLADFPRILRAIADEAEAGEYGTLSMGALVLEDEQGNIRTFGLGQMADYYRAYALFHLGLANLVAKRGLDFML
jgi:hypothetical protein